ncbi:hypothetical protein LUZ60_009279 [Juncus effusus]|nr:hypothetical protein LUZ60_009279 [Juncus effusus]
MEDALLDVVINKINYTLGSKILETEKLKLKKKGIEVDNLERSMDRVQSEFILLKAQLREKFIRVPPDNLNTIREVASDVEDIIEQYEYFLGNSNLNIDHWPKILNDFIYRISRANVSSLHIEECRGWNERAFQTEEGGKLTQWLLDSTQGCTIISIWGTRSETKKNAIKEVYENGDTKRGFGCCAWLDVPRNTDFDIKKLLRDMARQFTGSEIIEDDNLETRIKSFLNDKRYLIVLNDVEGIENWPLLDSILPHNNLGSKVVITTHSEEVASLANENHMLEMRNFNDLPDYLKCCALYCSLLPKDHLIERKWIIRLWIAEGFVCDRGYSNKTLEELGEDIINELAEYSYIQVLKKGISERIKKFKTRELTGVTGKEKFGIALDGSDISDEERNAPRVFVKKGNARELGATARYIRSFILLDENTSLSWKDFEEIEPNSFNFFNKLKYPFLKKHAFTNFKYLRILSLRGAKISVVSDAIYELFNLHYLDLASTKVKKIGSSVGKLIMLKWLDLRLTDVTLLPKEVQCLKDLRHLYVEPVYMQVDGTCELKGLQTLKKIKAERILVQHLPKLKKLNNLFIIDVQGRFAGEFWDSLSRIRCLKTLGVVARDKDVLSLENIQLSENMEKIYLKGRLEEINPTTFDHFDSLKDFRMVMSQLQRDPLDSLSKMNGLVNLRLDKAYNGKKLTFCDGWFPNLKKLELWRMLSLSEIEIKEGTMTNLRCLCFSILPKLSVPIGLSYLQTLEKIEVCYMSEAFGQILAASVGTSVMIICTNSIQGN